MARTIFTHQMSSHWVQKVELLEASTKAKARKALVFVHLYEASAVWVKACVVVKVPTDLPNKNAAMLACHKAYKMGIGYSWMMWARKRIKEKYSSLSEVESFNQVLRNLSTEWMPRTSPEGRRHIEQVLKLGNFTSSAYPALIA